MAQLTALCELDINGAAVPIWRPKAYTSRAASILGQPPVVLTATIVQPADAPAGTPLKTWVKTYTYTADTDQLVGDSGWVLQ